MKVFKLTRNEQNGIFGILIIFIGILFYQYYQGNKEIKFVSANIDQVEINREKPKEVEPSKVKAKLDYSKPSSKLKSVVAKAFETFNPNDVDAMYWQKLGFEKSLVNRINSYITNGEGIKSADDLKAIYGMDASWIDNIKDSIKIDSKVICLNSCSSNELSTLKGIGDKLSNRIIKFRNKLGGFHSVNQLFLVYGIDSLTIVNAKKSLKIKSAPDKIKVETGSLKNFSSHLYINETQAEEIIKIRSIHGRIDSVALKNIFTYKEWKLVNPYLKW